ncbi:MAG: Curli production assembly/transport component CsgG [Firmicutes bacterium ADurb.Bin506]|jgi:curli biogenesis system outer membrane secretion channel CsgG|nr:MAG: Curli production assembly/transport component CsgG [Firmicutes bacterium ADurb.Bin506]
MITRSSVRTRIVRLLAMALIAVVAVCAYPVAAQIDNALTVAVLNFDMANVRQWWTWSWDVSDGIAGLVAEALVGKGNYKVLEREQLKAILAEQDFGASGRVDESKAVEIGKLLGARLLIFGTVNEFDYASTGGIKILGVTLSGSKAVTSLSGRIVDALTGEILGSVTGSAEEKGTSFSLNTYMGLSFSAKEFKNSTVGKSVDAAIDSFASAAAAKIEEVSGKLAAAAQRQSITGVVLAVIPDGVIINLGSSAGVLKGQYFDVFRLTYVPGLMDPVRIPVGTLKIISSDPNAAVGQMEPGASSPVQVGDVVTPR